MFSARSEWLRAVYVNSSRWMQEIKMLRRKNRFSSGLRVLSSEMNWLDLAKMRSDPALLGLMIGWWRGVGVIGIAGCL